ncbi:uncharacterized protein HfgLR_12600 [Haloferax gibbonsii]|uniref:Uncharacterized protein n=1 Tax=Haloferax gibbonsii TaxID=35746 RepID=A0A871BIM1_HALGI|nr:hypothetical protein [Haloferax gibbonsii]QOS12656.1 uncharacterized protein HfgLR_12600 [Haloferax gibbonsii]
MADTGTFIRRNREKFKLVGYFAVLVVLAGPLALFLGEAWTQAHLARLPFAALNHFLSISLEQVSALLFGSFVGLLVLLTVDPKKRAQAILLWFGLVVSLIGLQSIGLFLPNINFVANIVWLLAGIALGILVGGGRRLTRFQTSEPLEFRRAATGIFYLLGVVIVVAFLEYHVQYPNLIRFTSQSVEVAAPSTISVGVEQQSILQNLVVSGLFIITLRRFVEYDSKRDFFILGPPASGKSLFLIGAYKEALDQEYERGGQTPMNPSSDLMEMVQQLGMDTSDWIVEATARGEMKRLSFRFVSGRLFPQNITLVGLDYAGEYLDRLPDVLTGMVENEEDRTLKSLAKHVSKADTLVFVLDTERFANNESLDISAYFTILQATDDKEVLMVATKADILGAEFEAERGIDPQLHFEEFREYVNGKLQQNEEIRALVQQTGSSEIHPVYYETKEAEIGDGRVPMRDSQNKVMTVGFDDFLELIGR